MRKFLLSLFVCGAILTMLTISASAVVVYNEDTQQYYSNDENDGTLCFTPYAVEDDGWGEENLLYSPFSYLNMVPTDYEPVYTEMHEVNGAGSFTYHVNSDFFVLKLDGNNPDGHYDVKVYFPDSDDLVGEALNVGSGEYKLTWPICGQELVIHISERDSCYASESGIRAYFGISDNPYAQSPAKALAFLESAYSKQQIDFDAFSINGRSSSITETSGRGTKSASCDNVPRNINGNQGKVIAKHTVEVSGHTEVGVWFRSSSDGLKTINLACYFEDNPDYTKVYWMNVSTGRSALSGITSLSAGNGYVVCIVVSTNSNTGKQATVNYKQLTNN